MNMARKKGQRSAVWNGRLYKGKIYFTKKPENSKINTSSTAEIEPFSIWKLTDSELTIGEGACLGPFQQITLENAQLRIGNGVKIGAYVTILAKGSKDKKTIVTIGDDEKIDEYCHLHCQPGGNLDIGKRGHLFSGVYIGPFEQPFCIGERVTFAQKAVAAGRGPLRVGRYSLIGSLAVIITEAHNYKSLGTPVRDQGFNNRGVVIGEDVWVGASATILDGSVINDKTVIGAGGLVKGETVEGAVYYGVPIRKSISLKRG